MRSFSVFLASAALGTASSVSLYPVAAQTAAERPELSAEQAIQLFEEAGFSLLDGRLTNRCGGASNPRVAFVDLNGDRSAEVHLADVDPLCYGKPGAYFAILARQTDGNWQRLIAEDGIVGFARKRTEGWNDLTLDPGDSACPGRRVFTGDRYGMPTACSLDSRRAIATPPAPPSGGAAAPLVQQKLFDWTEDQTPAARALSAGERNAIFAAAGIKQVARGKWSGCTEDFSGRSEAQLAMIEDLNDDGHREAMIRDFGTFCNGMVGVSSTVLTQTAQGDWQVVFSSQGYVNFLVSRGPGNFPDIEVGLQFSCFPYFRWNGAEYAKIAQLDREGRECKPF